MEAQDAEPLLRRRAIAFRQVELRDAVQRIGLGGIDNKRYTVIFPGKPLITHRLMNAAEMRIGAGVGGISCDGAFEKPLRGGEVASGGDFDAALGEFNGIARGHRIDGKRHAGQQRQQQHERRRG